jgi:uncharacterized repeat protein (TIGR01451 family)
MRRIVERPLAILALVLPLATAALGQPVTTKVFNPSTITVGGKSTITFDATNPSTTVTLTGVTFTDNLPAGLVVASPNNINGFCTGGSAGVANGNSGGTTTSLLNTTLVPSSHCTYSIDVLATTAGVKNNSTGPVGSSAGAGAPGLATLTVLAVPPPTLTKSFADSQIDLFFGTTALSFTLTNPNTIPLTGLAFTDTLPSGLVVSTPNGLTGSCGGGTITAIPGSNSISLSGATLAAGSSCTFSVNVTGSAIGAQTNTTSTITSNEGQPGTPATASISAVDLFFEWFFL